MDGRDQGLASRREWTVAGLLGGLVWRLALVCGVLYATVQVAVRTDWFRGLVEKELSSLTGMEMRVGRIRATEGLNLKIRDVISVSDDAGIELRVVRVRWRLFRPRGAPLLESIRVDGWAATFAPDAAGQMQPAIVGRTLEQALGWTGIAAPRSGGKLEPAKTTAEEIPQPPLRLDPPPSLVLRWGSVRVQDARGKVLATASGLDIRRTSMLLSGGAPVSHVEVRAAEVRMEGGPSVVGLRVEWIDAGERQFLAALDATDWGTALPPGATDDEYRKMIDALDLPAEGLAISGKME